MGFGVFAGVEVSILIVMAAPDDYTPAIWWDNGRDHLRAVRPHRQSGGANSYAYYLFAHFTIISYRGDGT